MPPLFEGTLRNWKTVLAFVILSILFLGIQTAYQLTLPNTTIEQALLRGAAFSGATFVAAALLCSPVFEFIPKWKKHWPVRRSLGVMGVFFATIHIILVVQTALMGDWFAIFWNLDPVQNPLLFGVAAITVLGIVALVSTDWAVAKLGKRWKTIQQLVYIGFWALIAHFVRVNPPILLTPPGYLLLLITALALLGETYWFLIRLLRRQVYRLGFLHGLVLLLVYIWLGTLFL